MLRACSILSILLFVVGGPPSGQIPEAQNTADAEVLVISELDELARWCVKKRLGRERNRISETILLLDPGHVASHRRLKHVQRRGLWQPPSKPPTPRNFNSRLVPELRAREQEVLGNFCATRLRILDQEAEAEGRRVPTKMLLELRRLAPDYEPVRTRLGEVRREDGGWVLVEGLHAKSRRESSFRIGTHCLESVPPPESGTIADWMKPIELPWTGHRATPRVHVDGTVPAAEIERVTRIAHASQEFFNHVFSTKQSLPSDLRILLLQSDRDRDALIDGFDGLNDAERERYRGTGGARFPVRPVIGQWLPNPDRRADGALRHCLGLLLEREYGLYTQHGWIWEGFGLCLTHRMIGTRLTYFIQHTDYVVESGTTLLRDLSTRPDWLQAALELMEREKHPSLSFVVGKNVNQMTLEDVLYAHALAAYLLDGRPDAVDAVLRATGSGTHPLRALEESLGFDAASIDLRLTQWLRETR